MAYAVPLSTPFGSASACAEPSGFHSTGTSWTDPTTVPSSAMSRAIDDLPPFTPIPVGTVSLCGVPSAAHTTGTVSSSDVPWTQPAMTPLALIAWGLVHWYPLTFASV